MSFGTRVATLFKADAHGVVDAVEDRRLMLKQHLRNAEEALREKKSRHLAIVSEHREISRVRDALVEEIQELEDDVELAIAGNKEELARFAIKKSLMARQRERALSRRSNRLEEDAAELEQILAKQTLELDELRIRVKAQLARQEDDWKDPSFTAEQTVEDEDIELELLRRRNRSNQKPRRSRTGSPAPSLAAEKNGTEKENRP